MSVESPSFHRFQEELAEKMNLAKKMGVSQKDMAGMTKQLAEWLEERKEPKTPEQLVLRELWQVADGSDQEALSRMLVKLVQHHHEQHATQH